jgi:hypothetical protein
MFQDLPRARHNARGAVKSCIPCPSAHDPSVIPVGETLTQFPPASATWPEFLLSEAKSLDYSQIEKFPVRFGRSTSVNINRRSTSDTYPKLTLVPPDFAGQRSTAVVNFAILSKRNAAMRLFGTLCLSKSNDRSVAAESGKDRIGA